MADTFVVEMNEQGRIVIPASVRKQLGIAPGSRLVVRVEGDSLVLIPQDAVKERLWGQFQGLRRSMADDLVRDRAREAKVENKE